MIWNILGVVIILMQIALAVVIAFIHKVQGSDETNPRIWLNSLRFVHVS